MSSKQSTSRPRKPRTEKVIVFDTEHDARCAHQMITSRMLTSTVSQGLFDWFVYDIPQQHIEAVFKIIQRRGVKCYLQEWEHKIIRRNDK